MIKKSKDNIKKNKSKTVDNYPDPVRRKVRFVEETYEYEMPFNYDNIDVNRRYIKGVEFHGVEMNPVNSIAQDKSHLPADTIAIEEEYPIIRVAVIGSACASPGYVQLEAEPTEDFYKPVDVPGVLAVRFRQNNLWGMHLRCDNWLVEGGDMDLRSDSGACYPKIPQGRKDFVPALNKFSMKSHYRENPLAGMSSAVFEIPRSKKVSISGGCEVFGWSSDNYPEDVHYSFRIIRITVLKEVMEA